MTRKNRRDPLSKEHDLIWADPSHWTRESRRGAGFHQPIGLVPQGIETKQEPDLPRYVRRNYMKALNGPANRRNRKRTSIMVRVMKPFGILLTGR